MTSGYTIERVEYKPIHCACGKVARWWNGKDWHCDECRAIWIGRKQSKS